MLVYMVADNTLYGFSGDDINEMKTGFASMGIDVSKCNLLIYMDPIPNDKDPLDRLPTIYRLVKDASGNVTDEIFYEYPANHDSASPTVIQDVITKVRTAYSAEKYGFIYWSHGEGWVSYPTPTKSLKPMAGMEQKWIGVDDNPKLSHTEISDLRKALAIGFGQRVDFLMFDACFMLTVETVYELREVADYVVSSPTEIPGPGAPYDVIVPKMFGGNAAQGIVQSYYNYYGATYDETKSNLNKPWTGGVSIGAAKTSAMENLAKITKSMLGKHQAFDLHTLKDSVLNYDRRSETSSSYIGYYDLYGVMERLLSAPDFNNWKAAYDAAVVSFLTTPKNFSASAGLFSMEGSKGLSVYLPVTEDGTSPRDVAYQNTAWYKDAGLSQLGW